MFNLFSKKPIEPIKIVELKVVPILIGSPEPPQSFIDTINEYKADCERVKAINIKRNNDCLPPDILYTVNKATTRFRDTCKLNETYHSIQSHNNQAISWFVIVDKWIFSFFYAVKHGFEMKYRRLNTEDTYKSLVSAFKNQYSVETYCYKEEKTPFVGIKFDPEDDRESDNPPEFIKVVETYIEEYKNMKQLNIQRNRDCLPTHNDANLKKLTEEFRDKCQKHETYREHVTYYNNWFVIVDGWYVLCCFTSESLYSLEYVIRYGKINGASYDSIHSKFMNCLKLI
jgi:hypothetical protein